MANYSSISLVVDVKDSEIFERQSGSARIVAGSTVHFRVRKTAEDLHEVRLVSSTLFT